MKKSTFAVIAMATFGSVLFGLGICMALIPEWNVFKPGMALEILGAILLIAMVFVWRKSVNKESIKLSGKTIIGILIGVFGSLLLGVGMCLGMIWNHTTIGMMVGIAGIMSLSCMIPVIKSAR